MTHIHARVKRLGGFFFYFFSFFSFFISKIQRLLWTWIIICVVVSVAGQWEVRERSTGLINVYNEEWEGLDYALYHLGMDGIYDAW